MALQDRSLDASIVICTHNRAGALRETLAALNQTRIPEAARFEVIVIDNASTDGTKAVIQGAAQELPIRYVYEAQPGAGHARNAGLRLAAGRLIFIIDDDCIVSPSWFETACGLLADTPRQVIGGWIGLHDPRDLPLTIRTATEPEDLTCTGDLFGFIHGCNMIFGRCVLDEIGLFDPALGPGTRCCAADDTDLVYRAFKAGIPVLYRPALTIAHAHGRRDPAAGDRLNRAYRIANGAMACKYVLRGNLEIVRAVYWQVSADKRRGRPNVVNDYLAGAWAYLRRPRHAPARPVRPAQHQGFGASWSEKKV